MSRLQLPCRGLWALVSVTVEIAFASPPKNRTVESSLLTRLAGAGSCVHQWDDCEISISFESISKESFHRSMLTRRCWSGCTRFREGEETILVALVSKSLWGNSRWRHSSWRCLTADQAATVGIVRVLHSADIQKVLRNIAFPLLRFWNPEIADSIQPWDPQAHVHMMETSQTMMRHCIRPKLENALYNRVEVEIPRERVCSHVHLCFPRTVSRDVVTASDISPSTLINRLYR